MLKKRDFLYIASGVLSIFMIFIISEFGLETIIEFFKGDGVVLIVILIIGILLSGYVGIIPLKSSLRVLIGMDILFVAINMGGDLNSIGELKWEKMPFYILGVLIGFFGVKVLKLIKDDRAGKR